MEVVGKVTKPFGVNGGVSIALYDAFPDEWNVEEPLWVKIDSLAVPLFFEHFERRGRRGALAQFADFDTPLRAAELVGKELYRKEGGAGSDAEEGGSPDEPPGWDDLIGWQVRFTGRTERGEVADFLDSEANPLLAIQVGDREVLVPLAEEYFVRVDARRCEMELSLPEGLLELYL